MASPMKNMYLLSRLIQNNLKPHPNCCCRTKYANKCHPVKSYSTADTQYAKTPRKSRKLRWFFITLGTGTAVYLGYRSITGKSEEVKPARNWQYEIIKHDVRFFHDSLKRWDVVHRAVGEGDIYACNAAFLMTKTDIRIIKITLYRKMPLKAMSRAWGKFNQMDLPVLLRRPLLGLYVWMFGCKLEEASDEELRNYRNLGEFFRRTLKPHVREVDDRHSLTSPADGKILHYGEVKGGILEQVKGVVYSLRGFLGPMSWKDNAEDVKSMSDKEYSEKMNIKPGHKLYHCVIYLAPGDYHRFHSASDWTVNYRRHFPGELLSVNPGIARWIQGLFNFNERVVYTGEWKHGFFSYTAVGATNVGSIKIYCDQEVCTNNGVKHCEGAFFDRCLTDYDNNGIAIKKGEMFGEFNLGSTVVLIFEAPDNFKFSIKGGQKVKFGEPFGTCN